MTRKQFEGQLREVVTAIGAAFGAWGVLSDEKLAGIAGLLVSVAVLLWCVANKDRGEILFSVFRKVLAASGSVLVVFGIMEPDKVEFLAGAILPLMSFWASFKSNGEKSRFNVGGLPVLFFLGLISLSLPSCVVSLGEDGDIKGEIDWHAVRGGISAVVNDPVIWEK